MFVLLIGEEGSNPDVAFCRPALGFPRVVNDGHEPIAIAAEFENDVISDAIGIGEDLLEVDKAAPAPIFGDGSPGCDLRGRAGISFCRFFQYFSVTTCMGATDCLQNSLQRAMCRELIAGSWLLIAGSR